MCVGAQSVSQRISAADIDPALDKFAQRCAEFRVLFLQPVDHLRRGRGFREGDLDTDLEHPSEESTNVPSLLLGFVIHQFPEAQDVPVEIAECVDVGELRMVRDQLPLFRPI